jgi:hypothetical protein
LLSLQNECRAQELVYSASIRAVYGIQADTERFLIFQ